MDSKFLPNPRTLCSIPGKMCPTLANALSSFVGSIPIGVMWLAIGTSPLGAQAIKKCRTFGKWAKNSLFWPLSGVVPSAMWSRMLWTQDWMRGEGHQEMVEIRRTLRTPLDFGICRGLVTIDRTIRFLDTLEIYQLIKPSGVLIFAFREAQNLHLWFLTL